MRIYIIFYSSYGHIAKMAEPIAQGAREVEGAEVQIWHVSELIPEEARCGDLRHAEPLWQYGRANAQLSRPSRAGMVAGSPAPMNSWMARFQGRHVAQIARDLARGRR